MKRIVLASMNVGGGHAALADSFQAALRLADPDGRRFEPVRYDSNDKSLERFYSWVIHHATSLQGPIYRLSNTDWGLTTAMACAPALFRESKKLICESGANAIISTHPILSMMLSRARTALKANTQIIAAIPDYGAPTRGYYPSAAKLQPNATIVMDPATRDHVINAYGAPTERVSLGGFLPRAPFRTRASFLPTSSRIGVAARSKLLEELTAFEPALGALTADKPIVLFMGGSAWTRKTLPTLRAILSAPESKNLQLVVVCGRDEEFARDLREELSNRENAVVLGFVDPHVLSGLMAAAHFPVLGSLAPASLQELLEMRCGPLMLCHFIPGTEEPHVPFLQDHGLGLYDPNPNRMAALVLQLAGQITRSTPVQKLEEGFVAKAIAMRAKSRERALGLGAFLESLPSLEPRTAPSVSTWPQLAS
ncbi:MAG: hypothetical protein ACT4TC_00325 [Myxococcaceae bacterium]